MERDAGNKRKNNNKKINKSKNNKTALVICVDVREALTIQIKSVNRTEENVSKTVNALVCVCVCVWEVGQGGGWSCSCHHFRHARKGEESHLIPLQHVYKDQRGSNNFNTSSQHEHANLAISL